MRNVLVTGGAGFIGSNFVHYWRQTHSADRVVVFDALTYAGNLANLDGVLGDYCEFVHADLSDRQAIQDALRNNEIDTVVHFAAESHVDRSITGPDAFIATNIVGTHNLLAECRSYWLGDDRRRHRCHHVSTDEVYGMLQADDPPFTETTPYAPSSPYSASKAAADHLVRAYQHTYGLDVTISNCSNNYGPYHFPEKLIPLTIVNLLMGKQIPVYGEGLNVRDWLHVRDHCVAIDAIIEQGTVGETYNVGGNCERTNRDVVAAICSVVNDEFRADAQWRERYPDAIAAKGGTSADAVVSVPDRPGHDFRYAIDASKLEQQLGFQCAADFDQGIRETVRWYMENRDWWSSVMDGSYREYIAEKYGSLQAG